MEHVLADRSDHVGNRGNLKREAQNLQRTVGQSKEMHGHRHTHGIYSVYYIYNYIYTLSHIVIIYIIQLLYIYII